MVFTVISSGISFVSVKPTDMKTALTLIGDSLFGSQI